MIKEGSRVRFYVARFRRWFVGTVLTEPYIDETLKLEVVDILEDMYKQKWLVESRAVEEL